MNFGKLESIDVHTCWTDEARDFTPWLATPEGVAFISESVGMELTVDGTEVRVGPYAADILATSVSSASASGWRFQSRRTSTGSRECKRY